MKSIQWMICVCFYISTLCSCDSETSNTVENKAGAELGGSSAGAEDGGVGGAGGEREDQGGIEEDAMMTELDQGVDMGGEIRADMDRELDLEMISDLEVEPDMIITPQCLDGVDNDEDGLTDYPRDPGCESPEDLDEVDPELFACEDGIDNDEDGTIDLDDLSCADPQGVSEESSCLGHEAINVSTTSRVVTDNEGNLALFEACRNNNAPEQVFIFTLDQPVSYLFFSTLGSSFDTLLSVRRSCEDPSSEIACNDDAGGTRSSAVQLDHPALGDYYIIVDGYNENQGVVILNVEAGVEDGEPCPPEEGPIRCLRGSACSEGVCVAALCSDGEDNDEDGLIDYPNDSGCDQPEDQDETTPEILPECADSLDNDRDGHTDFPNDPQCISASDNREGQNPACSDGLDNDEDGYIDLTDPGCDDADDFSEYNIAACRDSVDNDNDGLIDYPNDPGCLSFADTSERTPSVLPQCADGLDNDQDGLTDYPADAASCASASDSSEDDPCVRRNFNDITGLINTRGNTSDEDNDFQGSCGGESEAESLLVWRVEPDRPLDSLTLTTRNSDIFVRLYARNSCDGGLCEGVGEPEELFCSTSADFIPVSIGSRAVGEDIYIFVDSQNSSGIWRLQIDGRLAQEARCDGAIEWRCAESLYCIEQLDGTSRCKAPQCADGIDNDGDNLSDYPNDPGCETLIDDQERTPNPLPSCSNNVDDDGDGLFDFGEDPDCESAADDYELPACRDTLDNDQDGRTDFEGRGLSDRGCSCANDPTEDREEAACEDQCDNDEDGLIDLDDPGCDSPTDQDEYNDPMCRDGIDNDQDGFIDYPNDPGCESLNDPIEDTPNPLPSCGDGVDNDMDGLIDFGEDDGCSAASDLTEESVCDLEIPLLPDTGEVSADTSILTGAQVGSCSFGTAPEAIWRVELSHPVTLTANTFGSNFNTVLYTRSACRSTLPCEPEGCTPQSSEIICNRDANGSQQSEISTRLEAGTFYIFVDGFGNQSGVYQLSVNATYPLGGQCSLTAPSFVRCPEGSSCRALSEGAPTTCEEDLP